MADDPNDALRRIEQRLTSASNAAERLIAEAARTGERGKPPPAGWQATAGDERRRAELESLVQAARAVRELIPPDVLERLAAALKELLLAIRALIDWYLERLERRRASEPTEVEDIPIA
jgi:sugar-specific transcriptional regulator TrmB